MTLEALYAPSAALLDRTRQGALARMAVDLFKYGAASAAALALDATTLLLLNKALGVNYLVASATGFLSGLAFLYLLSVRFVFRDRRALRPTHEAIGFLVTGLAGFAISMALMGLFVGYCGFGVALAKISTVGFVFSFNFITRRALLFSHGVTAWAANYVDRYGRR